MADEGADGRPSRPNRRLVRPVVSAPVKTSSPTSSSPAPNAGAPAKKRLSPTDEGFSQIGGKNALTFKQWIQKLNRLIPFLGEGLSFKAQMAAATGVVSMIRKKLAEGIDPSPSPMTIALRNAGPKPQTELEARRERGAALATLGAHIVIDRPPQKRVGYRKAKNGQPGSPGKFAKGFGPCNIRFESEHWDKVAYTLEHGRIWKPPEDLRRALIARASMHGFVLQEGMGSGGYWIVPPRPFLHFFTGPEASKVVRKTAEMALMGKLKEEAAEWRDEYVDAMSMTSDKTVDDMSDYLTADDGEDDWTDLITFGPRTLGPKNRGRYG